MRSRGSTPGEGRAPAPPLPAPRSNTGSLACPPALLLLLRPLAIARRPQAFWLESVLQDSFPGSPGFRLHNGAIGGIVSSYMALCAEMHVPRDADLVMAR